MAVYERAYREYAGPLTPERGRFLVLARYAFRDVFRSRLFTAFFAGCFLFPLACAVIIYLRHNVSALLDLSKASFLAVDTTAALYFLRVQGTLLGFLIAFIVGPSLVSPDLRNNAMPLYLSRPLSRSEYVGGKMTVLVVLLSLVTWLPGLLLFGLQSYLEGWTWFRDNLRMAIAVFVASWIWIVVLSLMALAVSATVKWKPLASASMFGIFFVAGAMGGLVNIFFQTSWGSLVNLSLMVETAWASLLGLERPMDVPTLAAWLSIVAFSAAFLFLLARKVRAYEVVR
jgi:ABC-2 type transport system permease protein